MKNASLRGPQLAVLALLSAIASAGGAETAPPNATPQAAIPSREAAREQTGLKIAGLVVFVANSCPKLKPDYERFKSIERDLGLSEAALAKPDVRSRYLAYTAAYQADAVASCEKAVAQFGPKGSTLPNLFAAQ